MPLLILVAQVVPILDIGAVSPCAPSAGADRVGYEGDRPQAAKFRSSQVQ
jgi:hypothetical protein